MLIAGVGFESSQHPAFEDGANVKGEQSYALDGNQFRLVFTRCPSKAGSRLHGRGRGIAAFCCVP
jgi:hypothetical protein